MNLMCTNHKYIQSGSGSCSRVLIQLKKIHKFITQICSGRGHGSGNGSGSGKLCMCQIIYTVVVVVVVVY